MCFVNFSLYLCKKGNLDAVKEYLDSKLKRFKEKYKEMNIEGYWTTFKSHLFNAMDQYIPLKTLITSALCTRFSLVVRTRFKIFFSLVGSVTQCCKQCSSTKSIASWFISVEITPFQCNGPIHTIKNPNIKMEYTMDKPRHQENDT
jgi:hypothetical protein